MRYQKLIADQKESDDSIPFHCVRSQEKRKQSIARLWISRLEEGPVWRSFIAFVIRYLLVGCQLTHSDIDTLVAATIGILVEIGLKGQLPIRVQTRVTFRHTRILRSRCSFLRGLKGVYVDEKMQTCSFSFARCRMARQHASFAMYFDWLHRK